MTQTLPAFLVAVIVVQLVPGPGMLFVVTNAIAGGARAGVSAAFGSATGMVVHTVAATLGLATLLTRVAPAAYHALRPAGAVYRLVLIDR